MAEMERLKKQPEEAARVVNNRRKHGRKKDLASRVFENMSTDDRDKLLKTLGVAAGLIDDSDD